MSTGAQHEAVQAIFLYEENTKQLNAALNDAVAGELVARLGDPVIKQFLAELSAHGVILKASCVKWK